MEGGVDQRNSGVPRPPNRLNAIPMPMNQMGVTVPENHNHNHKHKPCGIPIPPSHPNPNTNSSPSSPYPQFMASSGSQRLSPGSSSSHSRSLSQPSFFSLDSFSLPPLSPSPYPATNFPDTLSMEECLATPHATSPNRGHAVQLGHCLPPRKGHRRSSSDSPLGISDFIKSVPQLDRHNPGSRGENSGSEKPVQLVLKSPYKDMDCDGGFSGERVDRGKKEDDAYAMDDLFSAYMNLDSMDNLNFSSMEDKDMDSKNSGSKTVESSDNEVESHASGKATGAQGASSSCSEERREGVKRSSNGDIAPGGRHRRSFSLDSSMEKFHIEDGPSKLPPPLQSRARQHSPSNSMDGKTSEFSMEFGNGEFTSEEIKKIMENDKLAEIAVSDPKRAKR